MTARCWIPLAAILIMHPATLARAQSTRERVVSVAVAEPNRERWKVGVVVTAERGGASVLQATVPVPMNWPEQQVEIVAEDISANVGRVRYETVDGGARQMVVDIAQLEAGQTARAVVTFDVVTRPVAEPDDTAGLRFTKSLTSLRKEISPGPFIESTHAKIRALADEIVDESQSPWEQVRAIFDWVRDNVEYRQVEETTRRFLGKDEARIKGALQVLEDKFGDCDEMASLFVALCRAKKIPARGIWVVGHSYCEFYLEDADGQGHWFPCEISGGNDDFGRMPSPRPILQKGDSFRVKGETKPCRYLQPTLTARRVDAPPLFEVVLEKVAHDEPSTVDSPP